MFSSDFLTFVNVFLGEADMLNERQIEKYFEDGYVIPDFQLPEKTIEAIQNQHNALLIKHPEFRDYCPAVLQYDDGFVNFCRNEEILDMVEQLIGPDIALWNSSFFAKPAKNGKATPWLRMVSIGQFVPLQHALFGSLSMMLIEKMVAFG